MIRLINKNSLDMEMSIGDSAILPFVVTRKGTNESLFSLGDRIVFEVKKLVGKEHQTVLLKEKTLTEDMIDKNHPELKIIPIEIKPSDTNSLATGYYKYTLTWYRADGNVDTLNGVNPYSNFILKGGVNK